MRYVFANIVTIAPQKEEEAEDEEGDNDVMLETAQLYCRKMVFGRYKQTGRHTQKNASFRPLVEQKGSGLSDEDGTLKNKSYSGGGKNFASLFSDPPR